MNEAGDWPEVTIAERLTQVPVTPGLCHALPAALWHGIAWAAQQAGSTPDIVTDSG